MPFNCALNDEISCEEALKLTTDEIRKALAKLLFIFRVELIKNFITQIIFIYLV